MLSCFLADTKYDFQKLHINLYPHPVTTSSILKFENLTNQTVKVTIMDILGNKIEEIFTSNDEIFIDAFEKHTGLYFYQITIDNEILYTGKFVIIK